MTNPLWVLTLLAALSPAPKLPDARAAEALDAGIARMGGRDVLEKVERVRLEMMTQWQRTSFDERPYSDFPSYEWNTELRDYARPAWRNTRRFAAGGTWRNVVDVVSDSVGARRSGEAWAPLNSAYLDERNELFTFAPERVLLVARGAADLRALPDTSIASVPHTRVAATLGGIPTTIFLRRADGLLSMVRYRAAQPKDFGLAPWGEMEVEIWYSNWQKHPSGLVFPMQRDVRRVGRPYKRMTVLAANFDAVAPADSFAVSDSLRAVFQATARGAMFDLPFDSARVLEPRLAEFRTPGAPAGAVKLGRRWVLLEAGVAPLSTERALEWLGRTEPGAAVAGAVLTVPAAGNGGVVALAKARTPLHVAPVAMPFVRTLLANQRQPASAASVVKSGRWVKVDGDSLFVEPLDLPDTPGAMAVYVPSLRWAYTATSMSPLHAELLLEHARRRGWMVERIGSMQQVIRPVAGR
jgi:hypothetical protein